MSEPEKQVNMYTERSQPETLLSRLNWSQSGKSLIFQPQSVMCQFMSCKYIVTYLNTGDKNLSKHQVVIEQNKIGLKDIFLCV